MKVPLSWLKEFADVPGTAAEVAARLAACGFEVASVEGEIIDVEVTANRPDALSVYGLAREAATAFDVALKPAPGEGKPVAPAGASPIPVSIGDAGCGRYALAGAEVRVAPSPEWLAARLTAVGVRPVNNVVDITNYVMLEMGHPMHAFDVEKLRGPEIRVRRARAGEKLTTLDGQARVLDDAMLIIADREGAVAVAGVMGGRDSEVTATTKRIAIESAWFQPASVRTTSKRMGLKTEASSRFERGADLSAPVRAIQRALAILKETGTGQATGTVADVYPRAAAVRRVTLRRARLTRLLGDAVPDKDVTRLLTKLGFKLTDAPEGWQVDVPSFRVDVTREVDLIEEVGRHWGFDRIPPSFPAVRVPPQPPTPGVVRDRRIRRLLVGAGLQEAVTFTFIAAEAAEPFVPAGQSALPIANPLSEKFGVLRPSLLPGLLDSLAYSRRRESETVRLFELGAAFLGSGEQSRVAWVMTGSRGDHWSERVAPVDLFDVSGVAELVGEAFGLEVRAKASDAMPWFIRGRSAGLLTGTATPAALGWVGQFRADLVEARGLSASEAVFGGEFDLDAAAGASPAGHTAITPLPRHPSIVRDVSIVVDERLPAAEVRGTIRANAPETLVSVREFDRYRGQGVPAGQVSLSLRLTFRDSSRTLTDTEVQRAVDGLVQALEREHGAKLRGQ